MIIGVPKEIKADENRVSLPPDKVEILVGEGHKVLVESAAGSGSGFSDETYLDRAGATIVGDPEEIYGESEIIVKVKEPQSSEFNRIQDGQTIFTYLHLAAEPSLADYLIEKGVTGIAYETVEDRDSKLCLLQPMSEIAGRPVPQIAARLLTNLEGGVGKLLGGIPGSGNCRAFILGGGSVGLNAAVTLAGAGADVTVADIDLNRLREIDILTRGTIKTIYPTPSAIYDQVTQSDVVVGAVLVAGAKAPKLITREMVNKMNPGTVLIDVAIDQGGCVEGIRPTSHDSPAYTENEVLHYAVTNMPGIVGNMTSTSLSNATLPYVKILANEGVRQAIKHNSGLARGVNTFEGSITYKSLSESLEMNYSELMGIL